MGCWKFSFPPSRCSQIIANRLFHVLSSFGLNNNQKEKRKFCQFLFYSNCRSFNRTFFCKSHILLERIPKDTQIIDTDNIASLSLYPLLFVGIYDTMLCPSIRLSLRTSAHSSARFFIIGAFFFFQSV